MTEIPLPNFDAVPGETLTRFLSDRSHLRADGSVKHNAFLPPKTGKLSTYWISRLPDDEIWRLGREYVAPYRGPILARADINSLACYELGLGVELDGVPHPRHANIVGWDPTTTEHRLRAVKLAAKATVQPAPTGA